MTPIESTYSLSAEQAVLGCLLSEHDKSLEIIEDTTAPGDFFVTAHRRLFEVVREIGRGDFVSVGQALTDRGLIKDSGWPGIYAECLICGIPEQLPHYLSILKAKSLQRQLLAIGERLKAVALDADADHAAKVSEIIKELDSLASGRAANVWKGEKPWDEFGALITNPDANAGHSTLTTGYGNLDDAIKIRGGHVLVIAAVQGHGKSTLAYNLAVRWWGQQIPGCVVSLEMRIHDLQSMILSNVSGIARDAFENRNLSPAQIERMWNNIANAKKWPWSVYDRTRLNGREFRALCRQVARDGGKFIVLDYFQLMELDQHYPAGQRHLGLEENMRIVKSTALETGVAVVMVSQLNTKAVEGEPEMKDLRGTGAIGQDADDVMLLWEPDASRRWQGKRFMGAKFGKTRRAMESKLTFVLDGNYARFEEV